MYSDLVIIVTKNQNSGDDIYADKYYYYHAYYKATWQRINQSGTKILFLYSIIVSQIDQINTTKDNHQKPFNVREQTLSSEMSSYWDTAHILLTACETKHRTGPLWGPMAVMGQGPHPLMWFRLPSCEAHGRHELNCIVNLASGVLCGVLAYTF